MAFGFAKKLKNWTQSFFGEAKIYVHHTLN